MNASAVSSERLPNRRRMWNVWNESVKRVKETSMETKEKTAKTRIKEKRLV